MMPSRGMGAISPSKMPTAKRKARRDDTDFDQYAKGGKVKFAGGGLYANIAAKRKRIASGSGEKMRSAGDKGAPKTGDFAAAARTASFAEGGESRVNEAGNYTKPGMRKALFNSIKAGGKGGSPGQWSARKAQMLAMKYKQKGGGYRD